VITVLSVAVAIVIAVVALTEFGHYTPRPATASAIPGRQQLIDLLAVLRRPQTKADLDPRLLSRLKRSDPLEALQGTPDLPLIRLATVTPWGEKVFLVPMKPPTPSALRAGAHKFTGRGLTAILARRTDQETLGVFTTLDGTGYGGCCITAASIKALDGSDGTESSPLHGTESTRLINVVPDGVAKIVFVLPRQGSRIGPGTPVYKHTLTVTAEAHGNVAAAEVDRQCCTGRIAATWYGTDGQVLKHVGSPNAANHIVPTPKPRPETALSRAAERDPSTPNHVWVTPGTGGPHTQFKLHFHVLLTGASYHYIFTGTRCPQLPVATGGVGGGLHDIRGQLWSDQLSPGQGEPLCVGTYRVSVTVNSLGVGRPLKHPDKPFGSATFTVHP